jgi:hypothetical protein
MSVIVRERERERRDLVLVLYIDAVLMGIQFSQAHIWL